MSYFSVNSLTACEADHAADVAGEPFPGDWHGSSYSERLQLEVLALRHHLVVPTAAWTAQQSREAFPWHEAPRYLLRDRDNQNPRNRRTCFDWISPSNCCRS